MKGFFCYSWGRPKIGRSREQGKRGQPGAPRSFYVMGNWNCGRCGWVYDPAIGDPEQGVAPGTRFEDLPDDWICPDCGAVKSVFEYAED